MTEKNASSERSLGHARPLPFLDTDGLGEVAKSVCAFMKHLVERNESLRLELAEAMKAKLELAEALKAKNERGKAETDARVCVCMCSQSDVELKKKMRTEARKRSKEKYRRKNREKIAEKARMRRKRQKLTREAEKLRTAESADPSPTQRAQMNDAT